MNKYVRLDRADIFIENRLPVLIEMPEIKMPSWAEKRRMVLMQTIANKCYRWNRIARWIVTVFAFFGGIGAIGLLLHFGMPDETMYLLSVLHGILIFLLYISLEDYRFFWSKRIRP